MSMQPLAGVDILAPWACSNLPSGVRLFNMALRRVRRTFTSTLIEIL
jgi:hypothetical protein